MNEMLEMGTYRERKRERESKRGMEKERVIRERGKRGIRERDIS